MDIHGNNNIIISDISDSNITVKVEGNLFEIRNDIAELKKLMLKHQKPIQIGDKIYNIEKINHANFFDIIKNCKNILRNVSIGDISGNFHIGDIITNNDETAIMKAIELWHHEMSTSHLLIIIIAEIKENILKHSELSSIVNRYGMYAEDWQPFSDNENETILDMITEFKNKTNIKITLIVAKDLIISDREYKTRFKDLIIPNIILITDSLVINPHSEKLLTMFNEKTDSSCFLWCIDHNYDEQALSYIRKKFEHNFEDTYSRFYEQFLKAYPKIELEITSKSLFFRRLVNIASYMKILPSANRRQLIESININALKKISSDGQYTK